MAGARRECPYPMQPAPQPRALTVSQRYEVRPIDAVQTYPRNVRRGDLEAIEASMIANGVYGAVLVQASTGYIAAGNHRWRAMKTLGLSEVACIVADLTDEQTRRIALADNRTNDLAGYVEDALAAELKAIRDESGTLEGTGWTDEALSALLEAISAKTDPDDPEGSGSGNDGPTLADRFIVPPFSVLDARQGYWQDRKRQWIALGIRGELGRDEALIYEPNPSTTVVEREAQIDEGGELWSAIRAYLRECLKASGKTQKAVNTALGVVGMASHWFGTSQPELPSPDQWAKLKPIIGLDDRYDGPMLTTIERPAAESTQIMAERQRRGGAHTQAAAVGGGGLSDQVAPRSPRPGGKGATAPAKHFGERFEGGDAWRSSAARNKGADASNSQARLQSLQRTGDSAATDTASGTSIFDPVLCEIVYRWFMPPGGHVLDPFGGEATKGIVAARLGHPYTAVELRAEQVAANEAQARAIKYPGAGPRWLCGDSSRIGALLPDAPERFDLVFTSPPYYDLEVYSKSEKDGSAFETYARFMAWYRDIFRQAIERLADNRFAVVKVGEVRDKSAGSGGRYRNFVGDNVSCFVDLGLAYYNEIVLVTAVGSLPVRSGRIFQTSRKVGKGHQNVLVFYKGDPREIPKHFPADLAITDLAAEPERDDDRERDDADDGTPLLG